MGDNTSGSISIDIYLSKHEGLLLENIRRMLQAETRVALLESVLQDVQKKNEELIKQSETTKTALDQAIVGLSIVTNEKLVLENKVKELDQNLNNTLNQLDEFQKLKSKLTTIEVDYEILKNNYSIVLDNYNKLIGSEQSSPQVIVTEKKRKSKSTESEWIDGKY